MRGSLPAVINRAAKRLKVTGTKQTERDTQTLANGSNITAAAQRVAEITNNSFRYVGSRNSPNSGATLLLVEHIAVSYLLITASNSIRHKYYFITM